MYAFRKPFAAGLFEGSLGPLKLKDALVLSQVVGYALSKFVGVKVITELDRAKRTGALLVLIALAEIALLFFAVLPGPFKVVALFANGLPLGMVWGLVFSFLEGRKTSEIMGAGLSTSYIVASGVVKGVGKGLVDAGVPEAWMPFCVGLIFALPFLGAVWALRQLPPPNDEDESLRTHREPMNAAQRRAFLLRFLPGLLALTVLYVSLTSYRDYRDNFAAEILKGLGEEGAAVFAETEVPIAVVVLLALAAIYRVRDNRKALSLIHGLMTAGAALIGLSTLAWDLKIIDGFWWMTLVGVGLYLAYVPYGCVLFDRLIAAHRVVGTAVFMIYVTDAFGYVGSVGVVLYKNFGAGGMSNLGFFRAFSYVTFGVSFTLFLFSWAYFTRKPVEPANGADGSG